MPEIKVKPVRQRFELLQDSLASQQVQGYWSILQAFLDVCEAVVSPQVLCSADRNWNSPAGSLGIVLQWADLSTRKMAQEKALFAHKGNGSGRVWPARWPLWLITCLCKHSIKTTEEKQNADVYTRLFSSVRANHIRKCYKGNDWWHSDLNYTAWPFNSALQWLLSL